MRISNIIRHNSAQNQNMFPDFPLDFAVSGRERGDPGASLFVVCGECQYDVTYECEDHCSLYHDRLTDDYIKCTLL